MKGVGLFCASPASTAICSSLDQRSMVHRATRPIDRQSSKSYAPCSSQLPISPRRYNYERSRKGSARLNDLRRKSSADISDPQSPSGSSRYLLGGDGVPYTDWMSESDHAVSALVPTHQDAKVKQKRSPVDFPARRSCSMIVRSGNWVSGSDNVSAMVPAEHGIFQQKISNDSPALRSSSSARSREQVVVLRVSIHCKGCEGKVRKHISKMEGVTSFSIDLAAKKVTVIGEVTPLGVLASVSKVKNAQLWPSSSTTDSSSLPSPSPRWST